MRYWVWWESGGCNNQDHDTGLECFGTRAEAESFLAGKDSADLSWVIIFGEGVVDDGG